ncbi:hypothetical protein C9374_004053, partial [Naegleria lovaniensis]
MMSTSKLLVGLLLVATCVILAVLPTEARKFRAARSVKAVNSVLQRCQSVGDPHYVSFTGRRYDFYGVGDYVLAETADKSFIAHARTGKWKKVSVNTAFAVKINQKDTFEYDTKTNSFYLNGKQTKVSVGQTVQLSGSATAKRVSANSLIVSAKNGAHLTATWHRNPAFRSRYGSFGHISLILDAPRSLKFSSGLCISREYLSRTARGVLHNHVHRRVERRVKPKKPTKKQLKRARKACRKAGLKKKKNPNAFHACVADQILAGKKLGKDFAKTIVKVEKLEKKKSKKWKKQARKIIKK